MAVGDPGRRPCEAAFEAGGRSLPSRLHARPSRDPRSHTPHSPHPQVGPFLPGYTPGDLGFDPLGMAPKTDADMLAMKNKELNNGRLAMMAVAGIVAQEVVTGQELLGSA